MEPSRHGHVICPPPRCSIRMSDINCEHKVYSYSSREHWESCGPQDRTRFSLIRRNAHNQAADRDDDPIHHINPATSYKTNHQTPTPPGQPLTHPDRHLHPLDPVLQIHLSRSLGLVPPPLPQSPERHSPGPPRFPSDMDLSPARLSGGAVPLRTTDVYRGKSTGHARARGADLEQRRDVS